MVTITRTSPFSQKENTMTLNCSAEQYNKGMEKWGAGFPIQNAFPFLSPDEREFIKTGIMPDEWDAMFGGQE